MPVMASLHGLPPLPKSLRSLLQAGSAQWKETERMLAMRSSIQQDLQRQKEDNGPGGDYFRRRSDGRRPSLEAAIAHLRREMVGLRQVDMALLCQLWGLNEGIQEYKHSMHDRFSETNSECSSYSLENGHLGLEDVEEEGLLPHLEEEEEDELSRKHRFRNSLRDSAAGSSLADSAFDEPMYLEPTHSTSSSYHKGHLDVRYSNGSIPSPSPSRASRDSAMTTGTSHNYNYESNL